ncbi:hypothetical protein RJ40_01915 [Methanofollis aquaemaris]|uniref:Uncharacterized protein n=1 Tax=Methanofollis aquaemaris TaxID=126734 RepID=A0A8A3S3M5_9EURY|nr:hypothetical protein [Methanofollis aquaemaris]QSZ66341.1 hypothetical protein RJ40_01915 [Methanofollis aquaemaris]
MLHTREIIKKLWDAQGYGNLAIWEDGSTEVVAPESQPEKGGKAPLVVLKPLAMVAGFPMLDYALHDAELLAAVEKAIQDAGAEIVRD